MSAFQDLTGQTFGRLTVIKQGPSARRGGARWFCQCSCGNTELTLVTAGNLKSGHTQSCGCYNNEIIRGKAEDLKGRVFGKLTAIERAGYKTTQSGQRNILWKCQCDCGRETIVPAKDLKSGNTQSCGQCKYENRYEFRDDCVIGYTNTGVPFYIDSEDYDRVKHYYWRYDSNEHHGYIETFVGHKRVLLHRLIMNAAPKDVIDHINHQTTDARKVNLRKVTAVQNAVNRKIRSDNKSGVPGVRWRNTKGTKNWIAEITVNKEVIRLGSFYTKEEAVAARKAAEAKYFGEYAYDAGNEMVPRVKTSTEGTEEAA